MSNAKTILVLAIVVSVLPYVGLPPVWYRPGVLVLGLVIALLAMRSVSITLPAIRQPGLFDHEKKEKEVTSETSHD